MGDHYNTLKEKSLGEYKEKGSKFIAIALPISSVEDVTTNLGAIRKEYHDARHHCYAYRIGYEGEEYRTNDDGEPSGTAGKPIHGQMLSFDVTNILIVVVRYFGGTKLGVSGLIRAYKTAAMDALESGKIIQKTIRDYYQITYPYERMNAVMKIIKEESLDVKNRDFGLLCEIKFAVKKSEAKKNVEKFNKIKDLIIKYLETI